MGVLELLAAIGGNVARMGSRERRQRMALEKELEAKEKAELAAKREATGSTRKSSKSTAAAAGTRMKMVWQVYDVSMKEVAVYPYPQKAQAEAHAAELSEKKGKEHGVRSIQVPMD